ncbi:MAG: hypothetical protein ABSH19_04225 [Opitutales bacterium]|jgi:hypothetical protein
MRALMFGALAGALTLRGQSAPPLNWPTPAEPTPAGWAEWSQPAGEQPPAFQVVKTGSQYSVIFTGMKSGSPPRWPLWSAGMPPVVLHYYQSAAATTPGVSILVYKAGELTGQTPAGNSTLTIERAVIIDAGTNRPLGDALWAVRPPAGSAPLPQPEWTWAPDKLTVTNPFEKTIQEISLTPKTGKN